MAYKFIKEAAKDMQDYYNDMYGTDYKWSFKIIDKQRMEATWSYCDVKITFTCEPSKTGENEWEVKSRDQDGELLRFYLVGENFWDDYKDKKEAIAACVRNTVQLCNNIY